MVASIFATHFKTLSLKNVLKNKSSVLKLLNTHETFVLRSDFYMSYSIVRVSKVKSGTNTTGIQKHVQRKIIIMKMKI